MKRPRSFTPLVLLVAATLTACGSATKTVSVSEQPVASGTTSSTTAQQPTTTATSTTTAPATPTSTGGGTAAPSTTRTAPEPAFTETSAREESAQGAAAIVQAHGFTARNPGEYHDDQTLRVLVGTRTGSSDGYGQQAFFFLDGRYLGTDSKEPSATVKVVSQSDTEVVLAYPLYRQGDPLCCPGGGQATVHFQLNNGRLAALNPIPAATSASGLSRN